MATRKIKSKSNLKKIFFQQQYEDYIERTYPQWHQQVLQMKHRRDEPKQVTLPNYSFQWSQPT